MKRGDILAVTFLDHVESPKEAKAERFVVYGRLVRIDARALIIASWAYSAKAKRYDHNTTTFTIVRSAIEKIQLLSPCE